MDFRKWLEIQENATSSACIAGFARPVLPMIIRKKKKRDLDEAKKEDKLISRGK